MRIAVIDYKKCRPDKCGFLCASVCPVNKTGVEPAITMEDGKVRISEELCIGCGICVKKCPFGAITIINLPYELGTPVHQYGPNMFRLYGLPYPRRGEVIGIIGRNGIGKTTALRILAGEIVPNLGDFLSSPSYDRVIEFFKGTELQKYFTDLKEGKVRLAHKIQAVDVIRKVLSGPVKNHLPPGERTREVLRALGAEYLLEKNVETLSGGELQKLAIAAAILRDAELYFFDEPSSYLDIRERMRMSNAIRTLLEGKSVMVVEHDIAILDYLSDHVFIVFGEPSAYGRFSGIKGVREGINQFLLGFLKEENMRIRDYEIVFEKRAVGETTGKVFFSYPSFTVSLDGFTLRVEGGEVREGEVIGIVGPNGIGKTTFVRALAGEVEADPPLNIDLSISYKPQYVELPEVPVRELFKGINTEIYEEEIRRPLEMDRLMDAVASELSGGEKQRVAIALTLARDADLYLLDEPSAFLDVEQRVRVSKVINRVMAKRRRPAFIVDHDIAFIDYISDRLLVFLGEPGKEGRASSPKNKRTGMNELLKYLNITFRRDPHTGRPRINKPGSQKDVEQRKKGEYYYA